LQWRAGSLGLVRSKRICVIIWRTEYEARFVKVGGTFVARLCPK